MVYKHHTNKFIYRHCIPSNDITIYAKWTETISVVSNVVTILENDWDFTCNDNICTYEDRSDLIYTFNFNTLIFTKELTDNSTTGDDQTKHEIVEMDENWNISYSVDIEYLETQTASMSISENGQTDTYNITSFSSNYLTESNVYDDAVQFIDGPYGAG